MLVKKTGGAQNGLEPELQCLQRLEPGIQFGCDQGADWLELTLGRRPTEGAAGEGPQAPINRLRVQVARFEIAVKHAVPRRRPALLMRTLNLDLPDAQLRAAIGLQHTVGFLVARLKLCKWPKFWVLVRTVGEHTDHTLGGDRAVAEADLRLIAFFEVTGPLEPLGLCAGQLVGGQGHHLADVAGGGDTAAAVDGGDLQYQRVAVAKVTDHLAVIVRAIHGRGTHADRVVPAVRNAALP